MQPGRTHELSAFLSERHGTLRILVGAAFLLLCPPAFAEGRGQAEVALQGYYLGGNPPGLLDISGLAFSFRNFIPSLGLLSGSFQGYAGDGSFQAGDNYLQLQGLTWGGRRWTFTGGDFRVPFNLVNFPFFNIYNPEIAARGIKVQASRKDREFIFFFGSETLLEGPRLPFRVRVPQSVLGVSAQQTIGRLQLGARFMRFSSSERSIEQDPFFFPPNREFRSVNSLALQSLYAWSQRLKFYSEVAVSASERSQNSSGATGGHLSFLLGPAWESPRFAARANYAYQTSSYFPLLGYFAGDRRGPFAEVRYRPRKALELYGSVSRYTNNLESHPDVATFRSIGYSVGASIALPWRVTALTQVSTVHLDSRSLDLPVPREFDNRQIIASLARPIQKHTLRLSLRDLQIVSNQQVERQRSEELEDSFQFKRFVLAGAVRMQHLIGEQGKNTIFFRGSGQARFGRLTAHAYIESGTDLVNRTVFATNTFNTMAFGITSPAGRAWILQVEAFRNRLTTQLNPESIFLLQSRGAGLSTALGGFNQWSLYFRLVKQIHWGGPLPPEGLERYTVEQIPLVGAVEGFVREQTLAGTRPAQGISVSLDQYRITTTDSDGRFRFLDVPEGPHEVSLAMQILAADYEPGLVTEARMLVQPRRIARADLDVVPLTSVQGKVTAPPGISPESVLIHLLPTPRYTTPDSEGNFAFYNLREGDYEVVLDEETLPANSLLTTPSHVPISLRLGLEHARLYFEFKIRQPEKPIRKLFEREISREVRSSHF